MLRQLFLFASLFLLLFVLPFTSGAQSVDTEKAARMAWFKEAKLGIFIHWGIYAVDGVDESWSFYNGYLSYEDYMKQLNGFTAAKYQPEVWADLISRSGARYAVLTTKHHDGVALWNTQLSDLNVVDKTPAARDLVTPLVAALRQKDLKVGLYYSLLDWSDPNYPNFTRTEKRYQEDLVRWDRFVKFNFGQLRELAKNFQPDLYWFDGDWEQTADRWKAADLRDSLLKWTPGTILNSRLQGYGDYATPEQGLPVTAPKDPYWELCMTTNDSWGYQYNDHQYKTTNQVIRIFIDCLNMGGNLLLDIGPKADGTIPEEQVEILEGLGRWTKKHQVAIYGSRAGIPAGHYYGPTTLSADKTILYLFVPHRPNGPLVVKGLKNKINRIWVVGNGTKLSHKIVGKQYWSQVPGICYIDLPEQALDPEVTVLAVLLDGPVELYREDGQVIESN